MELKDYQEKALQAFGRWREALAKAGVVSQQSIESLPKSLAESVLEEIRNYPKHAWGTLREEEGVAETAGEYVSRTDAAGRPIPHVCFKVPTGGGKTLLAAASLVRLNMQTGLVLWIMPTRAIYQQTKKALKNREHPYRQMLEHASNGRVKLLEKDDPFTAGDVANYLCVMLLMLPAANRLKDEDFLRINRDTGRYPSFFPDGDDAFGDAKLLQPHPDLVRNAGDGSIRRSLMNVFRMLRPVVILDEAHKAYGYAKAIDQFVGAVNRMDPSLVIELSATPSKVISNLLVDITGLELHIEEMIKLPVQVTSDKVGDWHSTLSAAHDELERLGREAESLQHSEGRYIRPIGVVRVERTGKDQRDRVRIHAEDVREYLVQSLGVPDAAVAVKSSEKDDLGQEDLLSELSQVRWIITKAALMEGWDCPFAYLLVMLDNTRAQRALTQLVGRVMRQPHARRTQREALDQCYVYCLNTDVHTAVGQVKAGLEEEGLNKLGDMVLPRSGEGQRVLLHRREQFRSKDIFLPMVLHKDGDDWIELDYQRHILPAIDWRDIKDLDPQGLQHDPARRQTVSVGLSDEDVWHPPVELDIDKTLSVSWFTRRLSDVMQNPFQAARLVQSMITRLRASGIPDDHIFDGRSYYAESLKEHVKKEVESLAKAVFNKKLRDQIITFDLETGQPFKMPMTFEIPLPEHASGMLGNDGRLLQLSLFETVFTQHFDSKLECNFAKYLDEQKAIHWWHRVAVRQNGDYYLRGWKQERPHCPHATPSATVTPWQTHPRTSVRQPAPPCAPTFSLRELALTRPPAVLQAKTGGCCSWVKKFLDFKLEHATTATNPLQKQPPAATAATAAQETVKPLGPPRQRGTSSPTAGLSASAARRGCARTRRRR